MSPQASILPVGHIYQSANPPGQKIIGILPAISFRLIIFLIFFFKESDKAAEIAWAALGSLARYITDVCRPGMIWDLTELHDDYTIW